MKLRRVSGDYGGDRKGLSTKLRFAAKLQVVILTMALLFALPLFARDKTDVIVMNNGDRLTGEIKGLNAGVLYISLDYMVSTSAIQWASVNHIESTQMFLVKSEDGSVHSGTLMSTNGAAGRPIHIEVLEAPKEPVVIEKPKVVQMTPTSNEFWQRFNGSVSSGLIYSKGNQSTQYQLNSLIEYPRERWGARAAVSSTLSSNEGSTVSTRNSLSLGGFRLSRWSDNWFYSGVGNFLQSSSQDISLQSNIGMGIGRYLKNTNRATIWVLGGIAWQNTRYSQSIQSQTPQNVAAAMTSAHVEFFKFKKTNLTVDAFAFPALSQPGRVYFNTDVAYYIKLFGAIDWNISFYGNWDNNPPVHFSGSDYGTSSGISYTFGNK
jgi:hypothetical protein